MKGESLRFSLFQVHRFVLSFFLAVADPVDSLFSSLFVFVFSSSELVSTCVSQFKRITKIEWEKGLKWNMRVLTLTFTFTTQHITRIIVTWYVRILAALCGRWQLRFISLRRSWYNDGKWCWSRSIHCRWCRRIECWIAIGFFFVDGS